MATTATVCFCAVIAVSFNLGNSLGNTKNQSPSKERYNFFDTELLQVLDEKGESNVVVSPVAVKLLLGMMLEGASGGTAEEIAAALRLPDDREKGRKEFGAWVSSLQVRQPPNLLVMGNRAFVSSRYRVNPDYEKTLKNYYGAGVERVGFENVKEATRTINTWVSNRTSSFIKELVKESQIGPSVKVVMSSVLYFKGVWSIPFAKEKTSVRCFYPKTDGDCKESLMMRQTGYFNYGYISGLDARGIQLPYQGGKFSMLLLLPERKNGMQRLCRDMVHVTLRSIRRELGRREVFVQIPKFEISYDDDLVDTLKKLGISQAFGPDSNMTNIFAQTSDNAFVSRMMHSVRISVDEEGTEAAAATGALFVPLMGGTSTSFIADRPFVFLITDSTSILFVGKVFSPQSSGKLHPGDSSHPGPKSRSMDPSQPTQLDYRPLLKNFDPYREQLFPEKIKKKTGKTEASKNRKQTFTDDRRRHVLVFS